MPRSPSRQGVLFALALILLWASLATLGVSLRHVPPFLLTGLGLLVGSLVALPLSRGRWSDWKVPLPTLLVGVVGLLGYHALLFAAFQLAPPVQVNLLNYLWPLLIVVFAGLVGGVTVRAGQWAGTLLGLVAAALLVTRGHGLQVDRAHVPGYLAALGAAVIWAAYSVLNRRFADVPTAAITVACAGVAVLGAAVHLLFERTVAPGAAQWLVLAVMGAGPVGAAFWLWDHGTKRGDIALLGSLSYLAPLLSTLLLVISGRAEPHGIQAVAIAMLLAGAWLSVRSSRAAR